MFSTSPTAMTADAALDPSRWIQLLEEAGQDKWLLKAISTTAEGLAKLQQEYPPIQLSEEHGQVFVQLNRQPGDAQLLKRAARIFWKEAHLPKVARRIFTLVDEVVSADAELKAWREELRLETRRPDPLQAEPPPILHPRQTQSVRKAVAKIIRKTGKIVIEAQQPPVRQSEADAVVAQEDATDFADKSPAELWKEVQVRLQAMDLRETLRLCRFISRKDIPLDAEEMWHTWATLGLAFFERGEMKLAMECYKNALDLDDRAMISWFNLGVASQCCGHYEEALRCYERAEEISPGHPKVWCNFGVLHFQRGEYDRSETASRIAVEIKPDYARAWDNLAAALGVQEKLEEAEQACQQAVHIREDYPESWFKLAVIYYHQEKYQAAAGALDRAEKLEVLTLYTRAYRALLSVRQEDFEKAESLARLDAEGVMSWMVWNELNLAYFKQQNYERAAWAGREAAKAKPDEFDAWHNLGVAYQMQENYTDAEDSYEQALKLRSESAEVLCQLGVISVKLAAHARAVRYFTQLTRVTPHDPKAWQYLGTAYAAVQNIDSADDAFARAEELKEEQEEKDVPSILRFFSRLSRSYDSK